MNDPPALNRPVTTAKAIPIGRTPISSSGPITFQTGITSPQTWQKGENQPKQCRDSFFALLFYAQVATIAGLAGYYRPDVQSANTSDLNYNGVIYSTIMFGVFSIVLSALALSLMMCIASFLIKASLIFSIVMSLVTGIVGILNGQVWVAVLGFIFFALGACYACAVWSRIPFATANLVTALTSVRQNCGITVIAYSIVGLAFGWSVLWVYCLAGIWEAWGCGNEIGSTTCKINAGVMFLLFVSYFWTHQVLQNTIHVSVAGTIGTWWYQPEEATSCCSKGVRDSLVRATTFSFGSICLGSLLVAIIQALKQLVYSVRSQGEDNFLLCIAECLLACIENLMEYFNKWAYIYVGLYGYSYFQSGKAVMTLFRARGWEVIITDDLVTNTLFLMSFVVGLLTGLIGLAIDAVEPTWFISAGGSYLLGFIIGLVLASVLFSVVGSAVNTVLVCFAEGPAEFDANHRDLSNKMVDAWTRAGIQL